MFQFSRNKKLVRAAAEGDIETIKLLHKKGINLNYQTKDGKTALSESANNNHTDVLIFLFQNGVNPKGSIIEKAFSEALTRGDYRTSQFLLKAGAKIDFSDQILTNVLSRDDDSMLALMVESGLSPNFELSDVSFDGLRAQYKKVTILSKVVQLGKPKCLSYLLGVGANPNCIDENGYTLLGNATIKDDVHLIKILLDFGIDPNEQDGAGQTPLMIASIRGNLEIVNMFINAGVNIEMKNKSGLAAIHYAFSNGHFELFTLLAKGSIEMQKIDSIINHLILPNLEQLLLSINHKAIKAKEIIKSNLYSKENLEQILVGSAFKEDINQLNNIIGMTINLVPNSDELKLVRKFEIQDNFEKCYKNLFTEIEHFRSLLGGIKA